MYLNFISRQLLKRVGIYIGLALIPIFLFSPNLYKAEGKVFFTSFLFSFCMFSFLSEGNGLILERMDRVLPWEKGHKKRFYWSLVVVLGYSLPMASIIYTLFALFVWNHSVDQIFHEGIYSNLIVTFLITLVMTLFLFSIEFLNKWGELAAELEQRKNKALYAQIETLQNQIKPHFLFNNLNAVTSIIPKKPNVAIQFIHQLANVYRYILDHQHEEVVPLETEIAFAESYYFLLKIRFGEKIALHWDIADKKGNVPPYVLQLLLENAIKHNIISKHKPLIITIQRQGNIIVVSNNLQVKPAEGASWGIGLNNIKDRYALFSNEEIQIIQTTEQFRVELPILPVEYGAFEKLQVL